MKEFPHALPVASRGEFLDELPLIPYLAAITKKVRIGVSVIDTPYRASRGLGGGDRNLGPSFGRKGQRDGRNGLHA